MTKNHNNVIIIINIAVKFNSLQYNLRSNIT